MQPVPALATDAGLTSVAQAWSAHLAAIGRVQDPQLTCVRRQPHPRADVRAGGQQRRAPATASGRVTDRTAWRVRTWPRPGHRQNMLNAGYDTVGIGVTCSGGQAWTVELFGYAYGDLGAALGRQGAQNAAEGDPVPPGPAVAGTQTGDPVYCPGQTIGPNGQTSATGGQYAYPYAVPPVPGEPTAATERPGRRDRGRPAPPATGWPARTGACTAHGSATPYGSMAGQSLAAPMRHIVATADGRGYWLVAADGGIFSFGDAGFYGSMGGQSLNAPVVDMAPTPDGSGYWLVASRRRHLRLR